MDRQNCILSKEELANNPSILSGLSSEHEFKYRCFACELIRDGCMLLNLTPVVSASAQTICHRFYYYYPFTKCHPFFVSMACVLIASKIEEELLPISRILKIFYPMYLHRTEQEILDLNETDEVYLYWRNVLMETEKLVLSVFGYHFYGITDHPHRYVLFFIKKLHFDSIMAQRAWNILNDCQQLPLCLQYTSNSIACAAIYLAAMTLEIPLPALEWWELFDSTAEDIQAITQEIIHLYQRTKITWLPDLTETSLFDFSSYENVIIPSPDKINLKQPIKVKVDFNNPQEQKKETNEDTVIRQSSRSRSHYHDHHSRRRSRSHSHHRNHSHRRSRSHDRDHHSHRRHHHH